MSAIRDTYVIKSGGPPSGDPSKYDFSEIQSLLEATNPAKVSAAGLSYNSAAQMMAQVAHELYLVGKHLAGKWEGADATAAQQALGQLYATANELYWRSQQAGAALQTYGAALPQYKGLNWPADGASPAEDTARQQVAEKVMQAVNHHIGNAWDTMPDKVQSNLPQLNDTSLGQPYPSAPRHREISGGPSALGNAGGGGGPSGHVRLPDLSHAGGGNPPGASAGGHGADLAGLPQAGGPLTSPTPPAPTFSGGGSGMPNPTGGGFTLGGGLPASFPGGGFGAGAVRPRGGSGGLPEEEILPTRPSLDPAAGAGVDEQAKAVQAGRPGPAATGGGTGGQREMERSRSTWLAEDSEIWTAGEEAALAVLGGAPAAGGASHQDTERERTVWLGEEREVWTGGEIAPEGTIGAIPERSETVADAHEEELEILNVEQLQELLDALDGDEEMTAARSAERRDRAGLFEGLDVAEMNEIGRLLDG